MSAGADTIAARVTREFRRELEQKRDELAAAGVRYPDGRPADLSYVIRVGLRAFLDGVVTLDGLRHNSMYGPGYGEPGAMALALDAGTVQGDTLGPLDTKPPTHRDDPDTSKRAASRAWPRANTQRRRALDLLYDHGAAGMTGDELDPHLGDHYNGRRRLSELKTAGWVEVKSAYPSREPVTRRTRLGHAAEVYVLTAAAEARIAGERREGAVQ